MRGQSSREASRLLVGAVTRDDVPQAIVIPDREAIERVLSDPRLVRALVPGNLPASVACIPLVVEGPEGTSGPIVLGVTEVWRRPERPFRDSELLDLQELVAKTARHVDLARQHQREHAQVLALQRRPLPRAGSDTIEVASVYLPTTPDSAGVGGDWVNSFPLPGDRTALVVGDVVGHGLGAAAAMGQLSMEARALLSAGLGPGEVLERLDETVTLLDDTDAGLAAGYSALGSTCCIAVYDPVDHRVVMSNAGHLPPVLVRPDGSATTITGQPHPGLGAEFAVREPFDVQEFAAPPGSLLALYTDGLVEDPVASLDDGIGRLTDLVREVHPWDDLQQIARRVVTDLAPEGRLRDDVTLLLARMTGRRSRDTATWQLAARDDTAAHARTLVSAALRRWHTSDQAQDSALLVISELVTNAVVFTTGPVTVRLVKAGAASYARSATPAMADHACAAARYSTTAGAACTSSTNSPRAGGCGGPTPARPSGRNWTCDAWGCGERSYSSPLRERESKPLPSRAVAVSPGAAAYSTVRLPVFWPASCARRSMSSTAAPPRLPVV